ncbi:hypothetical protein ACFE04_021652 [Oxalis oulophora]
MSEFIGLNDNYDDRNSYEEITSKRKLFHEDEGFERKKYVVDIKEASNEILICAAKVGDATAKVVTFDETDESSMKITCHVSQAKSVRTKRSSFKKFIDREKKVNYEKKGSNSNDSVSKSIKHV